MGDGREPDRGNTFPPHVTIQTSRTAHAHRRAGVLRAMSGLRPSPMSRRTAPALLALSAMDSHKTDSETALRSPILSTFVTVPYTLPTSRYAASGAAYTPSMRRYEEQGRLVTQIGSLPFSDVERAIAYSLEHDVPFLPELTVLGDAMLRYIQEPGHLSCLEALKRHRFDTVKIQCIGPATLLQSGYEEDAAITRIYAHIEAILDGLQAEETILFLDEPALGYAGFDYRRLWSPLFESFPVVRGVHVCGNMQWDHLFEAEIDIISFDASKYDITKYYASRDGKRIAWGIERLEDVADYRPGDLITLPCGMPHRAYTEEQAEERFDTLRDVAQSLRRRG
jgi:hypothetical protein